MRKSTPKQVANNAQQLYTNKALDSEPPFTPDVRNIEKIRWELIRLTPSRRSLKLDAIMVSVYGVAAILLLKLRNRPQTGRYGWRFCWCSTTSTMIFRSQMNHSSWPPERMILLPLRTFSSTERLRLLISISWSSTALAQFCLILITAILCSWMNVLWIQDMYLLQNLVSTGLIKIYIASVFGPLWSLYANSRPGEKCWETDGTFPVQYGSRRSGTLIDRRSVRPHFKL